MNSLSYNAPTISVVTLTWNSLRFIEPFLSTLEKDIASSAISVEIIVVDNGSTDGSLELLLGYRQQFDNLQVVPLSSNQGTTVARNIGIRMARGKYMLLLDSDTECPINTLQGLLDGLEEIPDRENLGILHPRLISPTGELEESARRFPTIFTKFCRLMGLENLRIRDESISAVRNGEITHVDYATSAAWLIPSTTFDRVGLLNECIFYSPEDVEFCARCWKHGLTVLYYPKVSITHGCQRLTSKNPFSKLGLSHVKGLFYFWWTYRSFFTRSSRS